MIDLISCNLDLIQLRCPLYFAGESKLNGQRGRHLGVVAKGEYLSCLTVNT